MGSRPIKRANAQATSLHSTFVVGWMAIPKATHLMSISGLLRGTPILGRLSEKRNKQPSIHAELIVYGGTFTSNIGGFTTDAEKMLVEPSMKFESRVQNKNPISDQLPRLNKRLHRFAKTCSTR